MNEMCFSNIGDGLFFEGNVRRPIVAIQTHYVKFLLTRDLKQIFDAKQPPLYPRCNANVFTE